MRLATFEHDGRVMCGAVEDDQIAILSAAGLMELISGGSEPDEFVTGSTLALDEVRLMAPIPRPTKNVFCVGLNYLDHVAEGNRTFGRTVSDQEAPVFFISRPRLLSAPTTTSCFTDRCLRAARLGGRAGRGDRSCRKEHWPGRSMSHVFGYTAVNDVTSRDIQSRHRQWFRGKGLDGSCPIGPWIVTADEIGDPQALDVSCRVNRTTKQSASTAQMIFDIASIIESLSAGLTLEPGDIIATGTPSGVGFARTPPEWLKDGDVVETEITGIGVMRNSVRAVDR